MIRFVNSFEHLPSSTSCVLYPYFCERYNCKLQLHTITERCQQHTNYFLYFHWFISFCLQKNNLALIITYFYLFKARNSKSHDGAISLLWTLYQKYKQVLKEESFFLINDDTASFLYYIKKCAFCMLFVILRKIYY